MAAAPPLQTRRSPAATGLRNRTHNTSGNNHSTTVDPLQQLLGRLEGVVKTGCGWRARCPAHGSKAASVSIAQGANGTVLVNAFCGCTAHDVLTAIGLTVGDLFPRRDLRTMTPAERSQLRQAALLPRWRAAMEALQHEATVLLIAANKLGDGLPLDDSEQTRMRVAALQVFDAGEVLRAR